MDTALRDLTFVRVRVTHAQDRRGDGFGNEEGPGGSPRQRVEHQLIRAR